jgi:Raf kinase inhibitor-like YbhB/YbcL family protein
MALSITSPAFEGNASIPSRYTCDGEDISPELKWTGVPEGTMSLALIVDDPDAPDPAAPKRTYVHWVLYDLPPSSTGLREGVTSDTLPDGAREGVNDWQRTGYGGPCPPIGRHRYVHKLYALDTTLGDRGPLTKAELEKAMDGHIIERAQLIGTYERSD